jgi:ammonium transporter, Amt family
LLRAQTLAWSALLALAVVCTWSAPAPAQEKPAPADPVAEQLKKLEKATTDLNTAANDAKVKGDSAWMLMSSALVMLMVPGLALFYCGMVRRKNVLATMMHSMAALAVVGVYWVAIGYALAFGDPWLKIDGKGILGFSEGLVFLKDVEPGTLVPALNIPVYLHMLFQGMFAIITPALISGAVAERIRFKPYCLFLILWVTFVYCPLAHMVWAMDWNWFNTLLAAADQNAELLASSGLKMVGFLGAPGAGGTPGALDFAGGTVVHIAAGFSSLAAILLLRKRLGYPQHAFHPNSMVLTLTGAGLLWFGWFGFNGGSAVSSGTLATSAFAATQIAAAAAGLSWMLAEWLHRGKPTALGLASGIVAGLVAVTPASGFVYPVGGLVIGLIAGVVCYTVVSLKPVIKYDDSLDAFGVHGVGGFLGAVLTGVFCYAAVNSAGTDGAWAALTKTGTYAAATLPTPPPAGMAQIWTQLFAATVSAVVALVGSAILVKLIDLGLGFTTDEESEVEGLDKTEHGEVGFDISLATESAAAGVPMEPRAATLPPNGDKRFSVVVEGVPSPDLISVWSDMCQPGTQPPSPDFKAVYPFVTTVQGNRFRFRGGDPGRMKDSLQRLFQERAGGPVKARVDQ